MSERQRGELIVSTPWPVRLFGDPACAKTLALPTILMACDVPTAIAVIPRKDDLYVFAGPFGEPTPPIALSELPANSDVGRLVSALADRGIRSEKGAEFRVASRAQVIGQLDGSPALALAWTLAMLAHCESLGILAHNEIVSLAARCLGDAPSGGEAEIFTALVGGTIFCRSGKASDMLMLERRTSGYVLAKPPSSALKTDRLADELRATQEAIEAMQVAMPEFDLLQTDADNAMPKLRQLSDRHAGLIYAHIVARDATRQALELLESEFGADDDRLAEMLDSSHEMPRDYMGGQHDELEALIGVAKSAGAIGAKLDPLAGTLIIFAPGAQRDVVEAVRKAGGQALETEISLGCRVKDAAAGEQLWKP